MTYRPTDQVKYQVLDTDSHWNLHKKSTFYLKISQDNPISSTALLTGRWKDIQSEL